MIDLVRNGPMYLSGDFPPVFTPPEWTPDGASFDTHNNRFAWADVEDALFHQVLRTRDDGSSYLVAGNSYLILFKAALNGSTIYVNLGGGPASADVSVGGDCAVLAVAGSLHNRLHFTERTGSETAGDSWANQVACYEVALVPVLPDFLTA
jgi:hypothetical protein